MSDITRISTAIKQGDRQAVTDLLPLVYKELRRLAQVHMAQERGDHTLQATALVHEAYLRLMSSNPAGWENKGHFFAAAGEAMRRILIEHARKKNAIRHGGGRSHVDAIDETIAAGSPCHVDSAEDILTLNDALDRFGQEHPVKAELVKLRYFAGLGFDEIAVVMGISRSTACRHWTFARAWMRDSLTKGTTRPNAGPSGTM